MNRFTQQGFPHAYNNKVMMFYDNAPQHLKDKFNRENNPILFSIIINEYTIWCVVSVLFEWIS